MSNITSSKTCQGCGKDFVGEETSEFCLQCLGRMAFDNNEEDERAESSEGPGGIENFGDYQLGLQIGVGAMGVVYEAFQTSLNRKVALKLISDISQMGVRRFHIGAEAAAKLDHPNIVPIFDYGEEGRLPFMSMKLVHGKSLKKCIKEGEYDIPHPTDASHRVQVRQVQEKIARLMVEIALAVDHAHAHGVIHRDLKSANIMIDETGQSQLLDFGLAKLKEPSGEDRPLPEDMESKPSMVGGTLPYMAPEQVAGKSIHEHADIYSLGIILFELLTRRLPFIGSTNMETMTMVMETSPRPPRYFNRNIDRELEIICLKCLRKNPDHRYGSAHLLAEDLQRWLDGKPILARPASASTRARKWIRRNPMGSALILSLFLGLAVVLFFLVQSNRWKKVSEDALADMIGQWQVSARSDWFRADSPLVKIPSRILAIMDNRPRLDTPSGNPGFFRYGIVANQEDHPATIAIDYSSFIGELEALMGSEINAYDEVFMDLICYKHQSLESAFLMQEEVDFLSISLGDYLSMQDQMTNMIPLAVMTNGLRGLVLVTPLQSGISNLTDLAGLEIHLQSRSESYQNWVQWYMLERGVSEESLADIHWSISEENRNSMIARGLVKGEFNLGLLPEDHFQASKKKGIVAVARLTIPPTLVLVNKRVGTNVMAALRTALGNPKLKNHLKRNSDAFTDIMTIIPATVLARWESMEHMLNRLNSKTHEFNGATNQWLSTGLPGMDGPFLLGGLSGLFPAHDASGINGLYGVLDRGPTQRIEGSPLSQTKLVGSSNYIPSIVRLHLERGGNVVLESFLRLMKPDGAMLTSLPNPRLDLEERSVDASMRLLEADPDGMDPEGITRDSCGNFWICEEYRPSIARVNPLGIVEERWVPRGTLLGTEIITTSDKLPAVYAKRKVNRGFEGVAFDPLRHQVYTVLQRPLANPDLATSDQSRLIRILGMDVQNPDRPPRQWVYVLEPAASGKRPKVSDLYYVGQATFVLPERVTDALVFIDLAGATDITSLENEQGYLEANPERTLESLSPEDLPEYGIVPVQKRVLYHDLTKIHPALGKMEGVAISRGQFVLCTDNDFDLKSSRPADLSAQPASFLRNDIPNPSRIITLPARGPGMGPIE